MANGTKKKLTLKEQREQDKKLVTGVFRFDEIKGGYMKFSYKKYKEDPIETFEFYDGEKYTIPRGVAKHLNQNVWYEVHANTMNEDGVSVKSSGRKVDRCSFQSLEFTDDE